MPVQRLFAERLYAGSERLFAERLYAGSALVCRKVICRFSVCLPKGYMPVQRLFAERLYAGSALVCRKVIYRFSVCLLCFLFQLKYAGRISAFQYFQLQVFAHDDAIASQH